MLKNVITLQSALKCMCGSLYLYNEKNLIFSTLKSYWQYPQQTSRGTLIFNYTYLISAILIFFSDFLNFLFEDFNVCIFDVFFAHNLHINYKKQIEYVRK